MTDTPAPPPVAAAIAKIEEDLAWRGPNDRVMGYVVLPREAGVALLEALRSVPADGILPCDIHLPPNTTIRKGAKLSVLLTALRMRAEFPDAATTFPRSA